MQKLLESSDCRRDLGISRYGRLRSLGSLHTFAQHRRLSSTDLSPEQLVDVYCERPSTVQELAYGLDETGTSNTRDARVACVRV